MTLATVPTDRPGDALAPLLLPQSLRLTAEQFAAVCDANPDAVLELDAAPQFPGLQIELQEIWAG